jgi:hypothetical protein
VKRERRQFGGHVGVGITRFGNPGTNNLCGIKAPIYTTK